MTETYTNPFADLEARMAEPPATGVFLTCVMPESRFAQAGLTAGEMIVAIDEATGPSWIDFVRGLQRQPDAADDAGTRRLTVRAVDGAERVVEVAAGNLSHFGAAALHGCGLKQGMSGWEDLEDAEDEPDFSSLTDGTDILLRNSLEETRAGYEVARLRREGDLLHVDILFALGGDDGKGGKWDYRSRVGCTHRLERGLPIVRTAFWEGGYDDEHKKGDVRLEDGRWRGVRRQEDGTVLEIDHEPLSTHAMTGYGVTLLPLTMPQREGATLTFNVAGEGTGYVSMRARLVCVGKRTTTVDGVEVSAWCYEWRHYGEYGESERFYVDDDRRLLRVDWGPNYAGCRGEAVPLEKLNEGVPEHIRYEPNACA